jgi:CDP-diacylglycerol--glycerol-3-phosphate 3-phosphatidyltransferase
MFDKPTITDRLLEKTILPFIPYTITPNQITMVRFILTPLVIWLFIAGQYALALPLFLFTALTDAVDGAMARTRNQITNWGKIFDPIADKLLIGSTVFVFVSKYLHWALAGSIIGIELLFFVFGYFWLRRKKVVQANIFGKIKMVLQVFGVVVLLTGVLWNVPLLFSSAYGIFILAIIFAFLSLLSYGI